MEQDDKPRPLQSTWAARQTNNVHFFELVRGFVGVCSHGGVIIIYSRICGRDGKVCETIDSLLIFNKEECQEC